MAQPPRLEHSNHAPHNFDPERQRMYNSRFSRFRRDLNTPKLASVRGKSFNQSMRFHMYAVIKTGGKQYKVVAGEKFKVEQIPADIGSEVTLDQVLAVGAGDTIKFGAPLVEGATVLATVLAHGRHDKVKIFKMRRRKHYQKHQGHRQNYTELQIVSING
jgi:large subunit ribosomal protein L21